VTTRAITIQSSEQILRAMWYETRKKFTAQRYRKMRKIMRYAAGSTKGG